MNMKKNVKGFTLIELMIVIIIIGILASVSVPMYRNYTRKAMASEGVSLCGAVASAERVYYAEHTKFTTDTATALSIDPRSNKYFRSISMTGTTDTSYQVVATAEGGGDASGIAVTFIGSVSGAPTTSISGL